MTVIAFDGKTLAADRRCTIGGTVFECVKIRRIGNRLVGLSGDSAKFGEFCAWLESGQRPQEYPKNVDGEKFTAIVASAERIEMYWETPFPTVIAQGFAAIGTGKDFAMAAMHYGRPAVEAVALASLYDSYCGNGVDTLDLDTG